MVYQQPTPEEREFLNGDGQAIVQGQGSQFWKLLTKLLDAKLTAAQESIDGCLSGDPKVTHGLHLRRYALKSVISDLKEYVDSNAERYRNLLADLTKPVETEEYESHEHTDDFATR